MSDLGLMVFQCDACKAIIGDSMSFECANEELKVIVLSKASGTTVVKEVIHSTAGLDINCIYNNIVCQSCGATLGRRYAATSVEMDWIRDKFALFTASLKSYELDSGQAHANTARPIDVPLDGMNENVNQLLDSEVKFQNLLLLFDERISALEARLEQK